MLNRIITLDEVDSTNNYLKLNRGELPDGTLVTARIQTAGKGRRGHEWLADQGMLPLSLLLKQPPHPDTLTLCAGVAVCEALEPLLPGEELGIKWPNDIILHGHKLCGILCESVCFGSSMDIVCGIGVNLAQTAEFFEKANIPHGGSVEMLTGVTINDRDKLAEDIAERLYSYSGQASSPCVKSTSNAVLPLGRRYALSKTAASAKRSPRESLRTGSWSAPTKTAGLR